MTTIKTIKRGGDALRLNLYLSAGELAAIAPLAERSGVSVYAWIKAVALDGARRGAVVTAGAATVT